MDFTIRSHTLPVLWYLGLLCLSVYVRMIVRDCFVLHGELHVHLHIPGQTDTVVRLLQVCTQLNSTHRHIIAFHIPQIPLEP